MLVLIKSLAEVVAIDPGRHTAVAYWRDDDPSPSETVNLAIPDSSADRAAIVAGLVCWAPRGVRVYIEGVQVHATSARSMASAGAGDLSALAYMVGELRFAFATRGHAVEVVRPSDWKGQLDDRALRARIVRAGVARPRNPHVAAAIGIGLALRGWL